MRGVGNMSELGLVSSLLLAGIVLGMGSVFLSMWFLPALLKRLGAVTVISQGGRDGVLPEQLPGYCLEGETRARGVRAAGEATAGTGPVPEVEANQTVQDQAIVNGQEFTNSQVETAGNGAAKQDIINEELMAAIAATLCAYGIAHNESYRIKQVRVVN